MTSPKIEEEGLAERRVAIKQTVPNRPVAVVSRLCEKRIYRA